MLGTLDGRDKPGQDEVIQPISSLLRPQNFPRTALRSAGAGGPSLKGLVGEGTAAFQLSRPHPDSADGDLDRRWWNHRALDLLFVECGARALCFLR
jgi:hypothetical protein